MVKKEKTEVLKEALRESDNTKSKRNNFVSVFTVEDGKIKKHKVLSSTDINGFVKYYSSTYVDTEWNFEFKNHYSFMLNKTAWFEFPEPFYLNRLDAVDKVNQLLIEKML